MVRRTGTGAVANRRFSEAVRFAETLDTEHHFEPHTHDEFCLGLITAGSETFRQGRRTEQADAGAVVTHNPGEIHTGRPTESAWSYRMYYLDVRACAALGFPTPDGLSQAVWTHPALRDALARSLGAAAAGHFGLGAETELVEALFLLQGFSGARLPSKVAPAQRRIRRCAEQLADEPAGPHTLASMAASSSLSPWHFLRAFKTEMGCTPAAYLRQARVNEALRHLRRGHTLADAAAASGFADQSHMTRAFKAMLNSPPSHFVKTAIRFKK